MHTEVTLSDGVLRTRLTGAGAVKRSRWRAALAPAIYLLRTMGGGRCYVFHRPGEIG